MGNMHVLEGCRMAEFELDIKYSFKGFISDNGVLYGRRRVVYWINVYMHGVFEFYISFILIIFWREVLNMVVLVEDKVYY